MLLYPRPIRMFFLCFEGPIGLPYCFNLWWRTNHQPCRRRRCKHPAVTSCHQLSTSNTSRSSISSLKPKPWMILRMNSNIGNSSKPLSINRSTPMTSQQWYDGLFLKASTRATCPCLRMTSWMATWMLVTTRQLSPLWHHKNHQKPLWL